jgi:hypothetical protein
MTEHFSPSDLESILRDRGVEPDEEFSSAAGRDQGHVEAWRLPDGDYLIAYGNNSETDYAVADNADDLAQWLEDPDLSGLDAIIQTANVRGADCIEAASEDADGPFYVIKTRHYYGPIDQSEVVKDNRGDPFKFGTYEDALQWIDDEEDGRNGMLGHNESSAPSYTIVSE